MWRILFIALLVIVLAGTASYFGLPQKSQESKVPAQQQKATVVQTATQEAATPDDKLPASEESQEVNTPPVSEDSVPVATGKWRKQRTHSDTPTRSEEESAANDESHTEPGTRRGSRIRILSREEVDERVGYVPEASFNGYESDAGSATRRASRIRILSREEVDNRVGYVPEREPVESYGAPLPAPIMRHPPQRPFTVLGEIERRKGRYGGRRHCRQHPRGCPRQCRRRSRHPGYRVVRPAYPAMYARPVRPAHSGYGPAWR